jgi:hypothetical protein
MFIRNLKKAHPVFITFRNTDNVHQKVSVNRANSLVALTEDILSPERTLILHLYMGPAKLKLLHWKSERLETLMNTEFHVEAVIFRKIYIST